MNYSDRAALVKTVNIELMRAQGEYGQNPYFFGESSDRIMQHIDRLLAERNVDAQVSADLDDLMNGKRLASVYGVLPVPEGWAVILTWPYRGSKTAAPDVYCHGHGTTLISAFSDAVAKAKGAGNE